MYVLIDYYTGKKISDPMPTREEVKIFDRARIKQAIADKRIFNILTVIEEV